jgi:hypothetical protein
MAELLKDEPWVVRPFCFGEEEMAENGLLLGSKGSNG